MTNKLLLNNIDHRDLRVRIRRGAEYGDSINQVLIFPTEYEEVQREYPILFRKDAQGAFQSIALLGLDRDENLFLDGDVWQGRYVPATLDRGPFSIVLQADPHGDGPPEPMIHVDMDDPRLGTEGEPLFRPQGGNAPYLEHVAGVLRRIYTGLEASKAMFAAFEAAGLIEPVHLEIKLSDSEQYDVVNYYTIGEERLAALDGAALARLNQAGFLRAAFQVSASLGNVGRLIDLKNRKRASLAAASAA